MDDLNAAEHRLIAGNAENLGADELAEASELVTGHPIDITNADAVADVGMEPTLQGMQDHGQPGDEVTTPCVPLGGQRHEGRRQCDLPCIRVFRLEAPDCPSILRLNTARSDHDPELPLWAQDWVVLPNQLLEGRHESAISLDLHHGREADLSDHVDKRSPAQGHLLYGSSESRRRPHHLPTILPSTSIGNPRRCRQSWQKPSEARRSSTSTRISARTRPPCPPTRARPRTRLTGNSPHDVRNVRPRGGPPEGRPDNSHRSSVSYTHLTLPTKRIV